MLKVRIIPILTFNGFALVKTKKFSNPRMVGNAVQAARVYNSRGVDELVFIDINASKQSRKINYKIVNDVIKECFMPVTIGGGIETLDDINNLLQIGADKIILKRKALCDSEFIKIASNFFGSQCISLAVDVKKVGDAYMVYNEYGITISMIDYIKKGQDLGAGEILLNSVDRDGMMAGFDINMVNKAMQVTSLPLVAIGGGGDLTHYKELFTKTDCAAVGSASIFHFTQFTPLDIKYELKSVGKLVRI
jgi:cyclase